MKPKEKPEEDSKSAYITRKLQGKNRMSFLGPVDIVDKKTMAMQFLLAADGDGGGTLNKEEWIAAGMEPDMFDVLDTDGSGDLDMEEIEAAFEKGILDRLPERKGAS